MNTFFAELYEVNIDNAMMEFARDVYMANDYLFIGLGAIFIPMILLAVFYRIIDPQPVKIFKWILTGVITLIAVYAFSFVWLYYHGMYIHIENEVNSAMSFTNIIAFRNTLFAILMVIVFSFIWNRTISINNSRNPL
ncbi:hypothetical protein [Christiangramia portivictoriae]|uniref:hypothetical protein n=1 Tax=Christiangramia portivictoriae TaxID=326069 RepID=UPI000417FD8B|nr:hypothetical protein [Christiangramia portivictoriae]